MRQALSTSPKGKAIKAQEKTIQEKKSTTHWYVRLWHNNWLFPVVATILLVGLTLCKVSGSSIGRYHTVFYGQGDDSNLLLNRPRDIRSDEWLVNTQMTIAQANNNFQRINKNIGNGQDMSVVLDVPYKEWS